MSKFTLKIASCIGYYEVFGTFVWPHLANLLLSELKKLHFWIPLNARSTVQVRRIPEQNFTVYAFAN